MLPDCSIGRNRRKRCAHSHHLRRWHQLVGHERSWLKHSAMNPRWSLTRPRMPPLCLQLTVSAAQPSWPRHQSASRAQACFVPSYAPVQNTAHSRPLHGPPCRLSYPIRIHRLTFRGSTPGPTLSRGSITDPAASPPLCQSCALR